MTYGEEQLTHASCVDENHDPGNPQKLAGFGLRPDVVPPAIIGEEGGDSNELCRASRCDSPTAMQKSSSENLRFAECSKAGQKIYQRIVDFQKGVFASSNLLYDLRKPSNWRMYDLKEDAEDTKGHYAKTDVL